MKKILKLLSIIFVVYLIALPKDTYAVTLKEYEDNVAKYTKELQEKESKIAKSKELVRLPIKVTGYKTKHLSEKYSEEINIQFKPE